MALIENAGEKTLLINDESCLGPPVGCISWCVLGRTCFGVALSCDSSNQVCAKAATLTRVDFFFGYVDVMSTFGEYRSGLGEQLFCWCS